jgi:hypothetical protein
VVLHSAGNGPAAEFPFVDANLPISNSTVWETPRPNATQRRMRYYLCAYELVSILPLFGFGMAFLIAMEERVLKGPATTSPAAGAPTAPATPIPAE